MNIYDFIEFLYNSKLIRHDITKSDDKDAVDDRLRIQNYVMIAKHLGVKEFEKYHFTYVKGPYSDKIAEECYKYKRGIGNADNLPEGFAERFINIVKDKSDG